MKNATTRHETIANKEPHNGSTKTFVKGITIHSVARAAAQAYAKHFSATQTSVSAESTGYDRWATDDNSVSICIFRDGTQYLVMVREY